MLGVVVKAPSTNNKQHIVLVLKPELPALETPLVGEKLQDSRSGDQQQGYYVMPKSKRGLDEEYYSTATSRKGSGVIKIKLPYSGVAAGTAYEVRGIDNNEFLCICNCKIRIESVQLLEDASAAAYSKTVQQLLEKKSDGNKYPPALDPVKGTSVSYDVTSEIISWI